MKTPQVKIPFWASLLTLLGLVILCSLGSWQIQRLHWKETLLAQIDALYAPGAETAVLTARELHAAASGGQDFLRGSIAGRYLPEHSFRTGPRVHDGEQGTHLYTPFRLADGGVILVNRGWIPADSQSLPPPPPGERTLSGLFRKPDSANMFTPADNPGARIFYHIDPHKIAAALRLDGVLPYTLYLEDAGQAAPSLPRPVAAKPELKNDHLGYAVFWFTMAGALLVIYVLRFLRPQPRKD